MGAFDNAVMHGAGSGGIASCITDAGTTCVCPAYAMHGAGSDGGTRV
jgi:hypothetical protein